MYSSMKRAAVTLTASAIVFVFSFSTSQAAVPDWPDLYDPFTLHTLNLEMAKTDLDAILHDTTFDIEVPAWFWAGGDEIEVDPILISVRRKSAEALPNELNPHKVSFKLDINEFKTDPGGASSWHGIKKLSLENGDDMDVVTEGFAWYLHRLASESTLDYQSGLASWVNLYINGQYMGVYVNVEQPDKQYLKNRGLWEGGGDTWLYKMSDIDSPEAKEAPEDDFGNVIDSPASASLCYAPFKDKGSCSTPADFKDQLNNQTNMEGMLTFGAVSAFHYSPDDLFSKGKNFYYLDYSSDLSDLGYIREYMQWDLDSAFGSLDANADMYNQAKGKHDAYEKSMVEAGDAPFREEYSEIIRFLLNGPLDEAGLLADLQSFESLLTASLAADANNKSATERFGSLAAYVSARTAGMRSQLPAVPPPEPMEGDIHINDLDGVATAGMQRNWSATVTVTVHDWVHAGIVSGATVNGSWSGGVGGDTGCVTGLNGQCRFTANVTMKKLGEVSFSVSNVTEGSSNYVSAANHDDEGDSDGNTITISRP